MKFRLLTACIVAAINRQDATARGTVWNPEEVLDIQEAEALRIAGLAEQVGDDEEATAYTYAQRAAKPVTIEAEEGDVETDLATILEGNVDTVVDLLDATELNNEQLDELARLETAGKARKTVLDAIAQYKE